MEIKITPQKIFERWSRLLEADPWSWNRFAGRYKWSVEGVEGGKWLFDCRSKPRVIESTGDEHDFEIQLSTDSFLSLVSGKLNPQVGFLEKQLKVSGKMKYVLRFNLLLENLLESQGPAAK